MYKVFVNDKLLCFLSTHVPEMDNPGSVIFNSDESNAVQKAIELLETNSQVQKAFLLGNEIMKQWTLFLNRLTLIEAAGGVVRNKQDEILMISRFNKWDLPKGKIEKGEGVIEAALREVSEECGIGQCEILRELPVTYHTYKKPKTDFLKKTYWFEMKYTGEETLKPQVEEGITDLKWMSEEEVKKNLVDSYSSIRELMRNYLRI